MMKWVETPNPPKELVKTQPGEGSSSEGIPEAEAAVDEVEMDDKLVERHALKKNLWEIVKKMVDIRAQQRDRNERDHNDHMERNTFADTLGLLEPRPFAPGCRRYRRTPVKSSFRSSRIQAAHEARDERLKMLLRNRHEHKAVTGDQRG